MAPIRPVANFNGHPRQGNTLVEFSLVATFLIPILFGMVSVGFNLSRSLQVSQVARDAGHLYVRQIDYSIDSSKDLVVRMTGSLGITRDGGNGVVILSKIMYVDDAQCAAAGLSLGDCLNWHQAVFVQRHSIGNASLRPSNFGTPVPAIVKTSTDPITGLKQGDIALTDAFTHPSAIAQGFLTVLTGMQPGETAYVTEVYVPAPDWQLSPRFLPAGGRGIYARSIF